MRNNCLEDQSSKSEPKYRLLVDHERVVLYVGKGNNAMNVYHRVGFYGLSSDQTPLTGVEPWLEVGFDPNHVSLGHW